jgi:hypothetical protein
MCRAGEQYAVSPVFRRACAYCERTYGEWYILSTRHYLLPVHRVIAAGGEPALVMLPAAQRAQWVAQVGAALRERCTRSAEPLIFVLYARQRHAEVLQRANPDLVFELPLSGMSLFQRLRWHDDRLRIASRMLGIPVLRR